MKIISRMLYPYVRRALDLAKREHGRGMTLLVLGSHATVGKDNDGEDVAIFTTSRDSFHLEQVETALRIFTGEITPDNLAVAPVTVVDTGINLDLFDRPSGSGTDPKIAST